MFGLECIRSKNFQKLDLSILTLLTNLTADQKAEQTESRKHEHAETVSLQNMSEHFTTYNRKYGTSCTAAECQPKKEPKAIAFNLKIYKSSCTFEDDQLG
jgi:hypothetical protein